MSIKLKTDRMKAKIDNGIGWMTFNNPSRHNALSLEMWQGMGDILESYDADKDVRVVIMRGEGGKSFVSGADISEFDAKRSNADQRKEYGKIAGRGSMWLSKIKKPLIALIEGYCIGGGLATALSADIRFASPDSKFGIPAAKLGLGYEFEGLAKLSRIVGPSRARDIMFSARFFEASEAKDMGLVNFVVPSDSLEDECTKLTTRLANGPTHVYGMGKKLMYRSLENEFESQLQLEGECFADCAKRDDYREGVAAFVEKRPAKFTGA